jgi:hypothetical protein
MELCSRKKGSRIHDCDEMLVEKTSGTDKMEVKRLSDKVSIPGIVILSPSTGSGQAPRKIS